MKHLNILGAIILVLFVLPVVFTASVTGAEIDVTAHDFGSSPPTIDGDEAEWTSITDQDFTLRNPVDPTNTHSITAEIKVGYDATNIYFFVVVIEPFQGYNLTKAAETGVFHHHNMWALGLAFSINGTGSSRHMGGESETSSKSIGYADILHWELETPMGELATGSTGVAGEKGNSPVNLDDEWATFSGNRHDDAVDNGWSGAWSHSNPTNGSAGEYTFELTRPLTNDDPLDAQFTMNAKHEFTIAYWSPLDDSVSGWSGSGHYTSSEADAYFVLGTLPSAPGFELFIGLLALLVAVPIVSRKRK